MDIKIGNTITVFVPFHKLGITAANEIKSVNGSFVIRDNRHTHHDVPVLSPTEYTIREYGCPVYNKMPANAHCCAEHPIHGFSVYKDTDPAVIGDIISVTYPGYLQDTSGEFDLVLDVVLTKEDGRIVKAFNDLFSLSDKNYLEDAPQYIIAEGDLHKYSIISDGEMYHNLLAYNNKLFTTGTIDDFTLNLT